MLYSKERLLENYPQFDFVFFWSHKPEKDGKITETCLSQWWKCSFVEDDITFCCAEQYMMYKKALLFEDYAIAKEILKQKSQKKIKELGRLVRNFDNKTWDEHKEEIVLRGNILKFSQNPELKEYLIGTGKKILVEASPYDKIWGVGMKKENDDIYFPQKWKGQNLLGFLLMETRDRMQTANGRYRVVFNVQGTYTAYIYASTEEEAKDLAIQKDIFETDFGELYNIETEIHHIEEDY